MSVAPCRVNKWVNKLQVLGLKQEFLERRSWWSTVPTWKCFFIWAECSVGWNAWIGLSYWTEPGGKIAFEDWRRKPNCIRISASWQQAASDFYGLIKINKKLTFSFYGSLNCNVPLLLGCKSCSFTHIIHAWHDVCSVPGDKVIWEERLCLDIIM